MSDELNSDLIKKALLIRRFEEMLLSLYSTGLLSGTVHTCIGQEWTGVALAEATTTDDFIVSNHRGHGHFLARTGDVDGLLAEIMGRSSGVCAGIGGTQHLFAKNYLSSGIQGGMVPIATGAAFARKLRNDRSIAVACIGDGTLGEGIVYESLNIAATWRLPLVVVLENNRYAQSTSSKESFSGDIKARAEGFGFKYIKLNTWTPAALLQGVRSAISDVRDGSQPAFIEIETDRLKAHSKGDDTRSASEIASYIERDHLSKLLNEASPQILALSREIDLTLASSLEKAKVAPHCSYTPTPSKYDSAVSWEPAPVFNQRYIESVHQGLKAIFEDSASNAVMIGEDICGPYGGAFKATKDLSIKFSERVKNTPISEAAIVGLGTGLALSGIDTIVEIMFGDFITLVFDQLHQHAAKFQEMYGRDIRIPLIVRTPMGGRRGYGPTHSQSIEKHFLGIYGLKIAALNSYVDPKTLYSTIQKVLHSPVLLIENKVLYTETPKPPPVGYEALVSSEQLPTVKISPRAPLKAEVTIVCYGGMLRECEAALESLFQNYEIVAEVICPTLIQPLNISPIKDAVAHTRRLVTVEEGAGVAGFGSEVVSRLLEEDLSFKFRRLSFDGIIPSSFQREMELLPNSVKIVDICLEILEKLRG